MIYEKNTHQADNPQVQRLNEIIEQKRISKADIARICGVSSQSVNNWFVRGAIGKSSAIKLADALGVSLEWVLGGMWIQRWLETRRAETPRAL